KAGEYMDEVIAVKFANGKALVVMAYESTPDAVANGGASLVAIATSFQADDAADGASTDGEATPTMETDGAMTQTYITPDESYSIRYPAGWTVRESAGITQFFSEGSEGASEISSGYMGILLLTQDDLEAQDILGDNIQDLVTNIAAENVSPDETTLDLSIGDHPAARIQIEVPDSNSDNLLIGVDYGNGQMFVMLGITYEGELDALEPILLAMLESIQIPATSDESDNGEATPAVATEAVEALPVVTSTSEGGEYTVSVSVPESWHATPLSLSGGAAIALLASPPNNVGGDIKFPAHTGGGGTPQAVANSFIGFITGTVTEFEVNGRPAARLDGMSGDNVILYIVVTTSSGDFALASFYGTAEQMAAQETAMLAIAATVTTGDPNATIEVEATPKPTRTPTAIATSAPTQAVSPSETAVPTTAAACTVSASSAVNLRTGAGTQFERAGTLDARNAQSINGQATVDGFVWWRLESGNWVRSDVVQATGNCAAVPTVAS
ncbi:MAG: hypothetical protein ABI835_19570, partial [Chloroflexota bacterium]